MTTKKIYLITLFSAAVALNTTGQIVFQNPSFEGPPPNLYAPPPNWNSCSGSPDTQPGLWGTTIAPTNGSYYVGFHTLEMISANVSYSPDTCPAYQFDIDIAIVPLNFNITYWNDNNQGANPGKMKIYGGYFSCDTLQLLWTSPLISTFNSWQTYTVNFPAGSPNYTYLTFWPEPAPYGSYTYFGLDNITNSTCNACTASITGNNSLCVGDSTTLAAFGGTTYLWNTGSFASSIIVAPAVTTTYTVITSNGSCSDTASITVTVNPLPLITATPASATLCTGDSVAITANGASTYSWAPPTGLSATTGTMVTANPLTTTTYAVTGTSAEGCMNTDSITITITSPPSVTASAATSVCAGESVTLTAQGAGSYSWSPSTGLSSTTGATVTAGPNSTTTYFVTGGSIPGCQDTDSVTVTVNPLPVTSDTTLTIPIGSSISLSGTGGTAYEWSPSEGLSCTSCENPVANPTSTTVYTVAVTNANNCVAEYMVTIVVDTDCGEVFVANGFSPNGDGQNDVLFVRNNCIETLSFKIYDRWGQKIFESNDVNQGWDGTRNGNPMDAAVFVYTVDAGLVNGEKRTLKGNVTLIR